MIARHARASLAIVATIALLSPRPARAQQTCANAYESAQELRRAGDLVRSRAELRLCERTCPKKLADDCTAWRGEVEAELPSVVLAAFGDDGRPRADVRVTLDAAPLADAIPKGPIELNPGAHVIVFEAADGARAEVTIDLARGDKSRAITARLVRPAPRPPPAPPPPPPSRSPLPYVLGAIGLGGLAAGAILGVVGQVERARLAGSCAPSCDKEKQVDPIADKWWAGAAAAIAGGALLGTGIVVYVAEGRAARPVRVTLAPASILVGGSF